MAKPKSGPPPAGSSFTPVLIGLLAISFGLLVYYLPYASKCATHEVPYNTSQLATIKVNADGSTTYRIAVVTDLDKDSKHPTKKNTWQSYYKTGLITITPDGKSASVLWQDEATRVLTSTISAGGRAMELSDLAVFDGKLLSVDDRTGLVYILQPNGDKLETIPWVLLNDGPGNITKGLKGEWLTVKDNHLYAGGLGKEWTTTEGVFVNYHPMYVKRVNAAGAIEHIDWVANYKKVRAAVGIDWPGYMIHEAVQWSDVHGKWFFMPRRASTEQYTEATDEFAGTDLLLIADEAFNHVEVHHVGDKGNGARGFSAFAFVPGSNDDLIVALKSEEKDGNPVASYVTLFRVSDGHVLLNEEPLHGQYKFEGGPMDHHHDHSHGDHAGHDMGVNSTTASPVAILASTAASAIVNAIENVTQAVFTAQTTTASPLTTPSGHVGHSGVPGLHDHSGHGSHDHSAHDHHHATANADATPMVHDHGAHDHGTHMMKMYFHFGFKEVILFNFWEIDSFFGMFLSFIVIFALGALYESLKTVRIYLQIKEAKRLKKRAHRGDHSVSMSQVEDTSDKTCLPSHHHHHHHNNTSQSLLGNGESVVYAPTVAVSDEAEDANLSFLAFLKGSTKRTTPLFDQFRLLQACLYCVQITLAYMLMLVAMTYNVYLTAAVVLGAGFGHWLFAVLQSTLSELASDACH